MSHRVTTQTEVTNRELAVSALKQAGWNYQVSGDVITITSGPARNATLDLRTGVITGDTDYHNQDSLGRLRQFYGEALYRQKLLLQGGSVIKREIMSNGDVKLRCRI